MSKKSSYSGGAVNINGRTVATAAKNGNTVTTNYNMSDTEKNIYDSIQNNMSTSLGNLFEISDTERKQWDNQLKALKNQGIEQLNDIYTPMETDLKNDIARRFGNFDNSVFLDRLNTITNKKAKSVADLSNSLAAMQNNLYTEELSNRMNTISFLSGLNTELNNNMINFMNAASANSAAGNAYNNSNNGSFLNSAFGKQATAGLYGIGSTLLSKYASTNPVGMVVSGGLNLAKTYV